jgi:hypothetical protein
MPVHFAGNGTYFRRTIDTRAITRMVSPRCLFMLLLRHAGVSARGPEDNIPLVSPPRSAAGARMFPFRSLPRVFRAAWTPRVSRIIFSLLRLPPVAPEIRWKSRDRVLTNCWGCSGASARGCDVRSLHPARKPGSQAERARRFRDAILFPTGDRSKTGVIRGKVIPYSSLSRKRTGFRRRCRRFPASIWRRIPTPRRIPDYVSQSGRMVIRDGRLYSGTLPSVATSATRTARLLFEGYDLIALRGDVILADADSPLSRQISPSRSATRAQSSLSVSEGPTTDASSSISTVRHDRSPTVSDQGLDISHIVPVGSPLSFRRCYRSRREDAVMSSRMFRCPGPRRHGLSAGISLFFKGTTCPIVIALDCRTLLPHDRAGDGEVVSFSTE